MNKKSLIMILFTVLGIPLGFYLFIITGSYLLLVVPSSVGFYFGYILGNVYEQNRKIKRISSLTASKLKR